MTVLYFYIFYKLNAAHTGMIQVYGCRTHHLTFSFVFADLDIAPLLDHYHTMSTKCCMGDIIFIFVLGLCLGMYMDM